MFIKFLFNNMEITTTYNNKISLRILPLQRKNNKILMIHNYFHFQNTQKME